MFKHLSRDKAFYKTLLTLSAPMILQNLINNSLSMLDTFMVGTLGEAAMAGVTLGNTLFFVASLLTFGLQSGCSVLISQYWGKGDIKTINRIMGIGFALSGVVSLIVALGATFFPMQIFSLTSNDPELVAVAAEYARVVAFTQVFANLSLIYIAAQRSTENPRFGMYVLVSTMIIDTFLSWVFIFGKLGMPAMGVKGAALGTLIGSVYEFAFTFIYALRNKRLRLMPKYFFRPGMIIFKDFVKYSLPVVLNEFAWGFGFSLYAIIIGHMPDAIVAVAAYTITLTIERLLSAMYFGVGSAASILVGKPLGMGDREAAHTAGVTMTAITFFVGIIAGLLMLLFTHVFIVPVLFPLFGAGEQTLYVGRIMLIIVSIAMPFRAFNFCNIVGVLRGGGDVKAAFMLDIIGMYGVGIPFGALAGLVFGANIIVVYLIFNLEEVVKLVFGYIRFSQKKWLQNVTRDL